MQKKREVIDEEEEEEVDQKLKQKTENVNNQHYDEAIEMSEEGSEIESQESQEQQEPEMKVEPQMAQQQPIQGEYNPEDYSNLNVDTDIKNLFKHITAFQPNFQEIEASIKVFVPEYYPAVGEVDAMLKMPRPDQELECLGLQILDEPALNQSKKAKLDLMMNEFMKKKKVGSNQVVYSIENAQKNPKEISAWINDVAEIQKNKSAPTVSYSKGMPDVDDLMQVWPQEVEELLMSTQFPQEEIDLSLQHYCELACNFVDIPVNGTQNNKNLIESLHVLFTLFSEFKQNQHFQKQQESSKNQFY